MINNRDQETIKRLDKALNEALDEIIRLRKNDNHRIMCLEAEIRARSAAAEIIQQEKDAIEVSLRDAKLEIAHLEYLLAGPHIEAHISEFPHDAEAGPAVPGERRDVTPTTSA